MIYSYEYKQTYLKQHQAVHTFQSQLHYHTPIHIVHLQCINTSNTTPNFNRITCSTLCQRIHKLYNFVNIRCETSIIHYVH